MMQIFLQSSVVTFQVWQANFLRIPSTKKVIRKLVHLMALFKRQTTRAGHF